LIDLWVDPEHRRRQLARRIVSQLLQFFKINGNDFIVVTYVEGNLIEEGLWRRLGFEPVLATATADRKDIERALGIPAERTALPACRSILNITTTSRTISVPVG